MENLKPYPKYKLIEAPWLSTIPDHWKYDKVKHCFDERSEKGYPNEPLLSATQSRGVIPQSLYENRVVSATKDFHQLKLVEVGDFVISLRSFQGGIEYAHYRGIISPAYTIMVANSQVEKSYFKHLAKSEDFIKLLQTCVTGIREGQNVDYKLLKKNFLPLPPLSEQIQIANYLDYKVALINKFIRDKKKEIMLLKEQKQAEINQAVTRGVNPNAKMKDCDISWIGEIPEHWEKFRLKTRLQLTYNKISAQNQKKYLGMENIESWTGRYIETNSISEGQSNIFKTGNLLFGKLRPYLAKVYLAEFEGVCSTELLVYDVIEDNPKFMQYLLLSKGFIDTVNASTYGSKMPRANSNFIGNVRLPIPSIEEQKEIIDYITKIDKNINTAISALENQIKLIQDYKTTLISDVVTGKVDVRNIVIDNTIDVASEDVEEMEITEVIENNEE